MYAVSLDRSARHDEAAATLIEEIPDIVSDEYLARIIVRAFLVDDHFDYIPSARQADLARALRASPSREAQQKLLAGWEKGPEKFSQDKVQFLQEQFINQCPSSLPERKKSDFEKVDYNLVSSFKRGSGD